MRFSTHARHTTVAAGLVAAVTLLGGCDGAESAEDTGPLDVGANGSTRVSAPSRSVLSLADLLLCVEGGGPVELLSLEPMDVTGDLQVADFDVVHPDFGTFADQRRPISEVRGWESHHRIVSETCGDQPRVDHLAFELHKSTSVASAESFNLSYRVGEDQYVTPVRFPVKVCDPGLECTP